MPWRYGHGRMAESGVVRAKRRRSVRVLAERLLLGSIMSVIAVIVDRRLRRAFSKPSSTADKVSQENDGEQSTQGAEQHADPSGDMSEARAKPADQK